MYFNIGSHHGGVANERLDQGQREAFRQRGDQHRLSMAIEPSQDGITRWKLQDGVLKAMGSDVSLFFRAPMAATCENQEGQVASGCTTAMHRSQSAHQGQAIFVGVSIAQHQPKTTIQQPLHWLGLDTVHGGRQMNHPKWGMQGWLKEGQVIGRSRTDTDDQIGSRKPS
jgi:hypothetical protein